jgi:hypothetical protein
VWAEADSEKRKMPAAAKIPTLSLDAREPHDHITAKSEGERAFWDYPRTVTGAYVHERIVTVFSKVISLAP